jgi:hypothetical protein
MAESERARQDETELMALADELLVQATEIRRHWSELAAALGVEDAGTHAETAEGGEAAEDVRRLVALDMLLSGSSREEVTEHLRRTFGEDGVDDLVASVFQEYSEG